MDKNIVNFVHDAVFKRQVRSNEEILRQAHRRGFVELRRRDIEQLVEQVCTPYRKKSKTDGA